MRLEDIKRSMQVFAVKTSIAHEKGVAEMIESKLKNRNPRPEVKSIVVIDQLRGYVFLEAPHQRDVMLALSEIRHVKGKVGQIKIEELDHFLKPEPLTETLEIGDKVEIIAGLFSGEKALVSRIDESKDEVTLSLVSSDNPIPIKVHADYLKVIEKGLGPAVTVAGEPAVVGRGIKEYTFGQGAEQKPKAAVEDFSDDFEKEGDELKEVGSGKEKAPEVVVFSGRKQKVVGELIDLNVDELDDDLDDFKSEEFVESLDEPEPGAGDDDKAAGGGPDGSQSDEDGEDEDWK
ncbi:MAG: transcription elongation factor Spt5 [Candidatus Lokiarchaeota archaeon]|nr:transcription elongation factor Spt5 [Candidatus Lokiarchaeota archaeon]